MDYEPTRATPANIDAERSVLGSLLIDADAVHKLNGLKAGDFFSQKHQWIFETIQHLNENRDPLDLVTITNELDARGQLDDLGGPAYLTSITSTTPSAAYIAHYADIVEQASTLRQLLRAASSIVNLVYEGGDDAKATVEQAEQIIFNIANHTIAGDLDALGETMHTVVDDISKRAETPGETSGLMTGLNHYDNLIGGFQRGDLIIIAARPSMGKSSLMMTMALNMARLSNARSAVFSLEMSKEQMAQRLLSMDTYINTQQLRTGQIEDADWPKIMDSANRLSQTHIHIDDTPAMSVSEIRAKARRMASRNGLDVIFVDYLQLMRGQKAENRHLEIGQFTKGLKALARELNVPTVALSQLSRGVESRADKRPMLSDLRESGSIEEDADVVTFVYREDYYVEDTDRQNVADLITAKHRNGPTGTASTYFRKDLTVFNNMDTERIEL